MDLFYPIYMKKNFNSPAKTVRSSKFRVLLNLYDVSNEYELGSKLSNLIWRRDSTIHYSSVGDLERDVQRAQDLISKYPTISALYRDQATTIKNYSAWKFFFPSGFQVDKYVKRFGIQNVFSS